MYQLKPLDDTIAAIATPTGQGGIGIIRLSGPTSITIADAIFKSKSLKKISECQSFKTIYGHVIDKGEPIDEALLTLMRSPKSYTTQDVVEISVHGGIVILRQVLSLVLNQGARLAEPGEFTKRAFLNGRIDLAQAEAVLDIIHAKTENFARISQHQLKGELSKELDGIRDELLSIYVQIEAILNFPEDGISPQERSQLRARLDVQEQRIKKLLSTAEQGKILKDGIRIVLCGKPNAGKSSLLNVLLKQDRAIVTPIAGTTRDALEETAQIKGIPFQLVDTAGILEPRDLIEEEAIKRSHLFIESADLVLMVLDLSRPLEKPDELLLEKLKSRNILLVLNKVDLPTVLNVNELPKHASVKISALSRTSIGDLENAILDQALKGVETHASQVIISNARHIQALKKAAALLTEALTCVDGNLPWEVVSSNIKDAVNQCDYITGRNIDQDLIDKIFSEFCIGK